MNKNCKGCPTYKFHSGDFQASNIECLLSFFNKYGDCPCTICLVKPVCEESCDDLETFSTHIKKCHREMYDKIIEIRRRG